MKTLRRLCIAVAFTLALAIPALAGEIQTPFVPPSQPQTATTNGDIQTGVTGQIETPSGEVTATGSATNAALNLIQSVLSLL
ncbi:MAG TPA: hypothetical protein VLJ61_06640 [Pyrinomonadaceae bacterium]|nr:hypothetical protein [Pyrinomonadaceae bacterium]